MRWVFPLLFLVAIAHAEVRPVAQRMLNDAGVRGARIGGFLVIPKIDFDETYNDNTYATQNNRKSDVITTLRPEVRARSNWNRHALNALASAELNRYASQNKENNTNYTVAMDGRLDVLRETSIGGGLSWQRNHEDRGDPNTLASALHPTQFDITTARWGGYHGLGKLNARLDGQVQKFDYKNDFTTVGALVNNDLRDRTEYSQIFRLGYEASPGYEIYAKGTFDNRVYRFKAPFNRNSRGTTGVAGVVMDLTGKTKLDASAGYAKRNYSRNATINEPVYALALIWNATDLTTLLARIGRSIEETTLAGSSGYVFSTYNLELQHALTRRWLATANAGYTSYTYKGTAANQRSDDVWSASAGSKYFFKRWLSLGLDYRYSTRNSNTAGDDYNRNVAMLRLTGSF